MELSLFTTFNLLISWQLLAIVQYTRNYTSWYNCQYFVIWGRALLRWWQASLNPPPGVLLCKQWYTCEGLNGLFLSEKLVPYHKTWPNKYYTVLRLPFKGSVLNFVKLDHKGLQPFVKYGHIKGKRYLKEREMVAERVMG